MDIIISRIKVSAKPGTEWTDAEVEKVIKAFEDAELTIRALVVGALPARFLSKLEIEVKSE